MLWLWTSFAVCDCVTHLNIVISYTHLLGVNKGCPPLKAVEDYMS